MPVFSPWTRRLKVSTYGFLIELRVLARSGIRGAAMENEGDDIKMGRGISVASAVDDDDEGSSLNDVCFLPFFLPPLLTKAARRSPLARVSTSPAFTPATAHGLYASTATTLRVRPSADRSSVAPPHATLKETKSSKRAET